MNWTTEQMNATFARLSWFHELSWLIIEVMVTKMHNDYSHLANSVTQSVAKLEKDTLQDILTANNLAHSGVNTDFTCVFERHTRDTTCTFVDKIGNLRTGNSSAYSSNGTLNGNEHEQTRMASFSRHQPNATKKTRMEEAREIRLRTVRKQDLFFTWISLKDTYLV